ncbi:hypothetical protein DFH29DRAFT_1003675 [Suillus ampliporus]|nr:hypothetical protein DFH29DRAFT_1003675 [Suillus ampliporus]
MDREWLGSARLEVDGGSGHSRAANGWGMAWVSNARRRRRIGTLTSCERMGNGLGQQGSRSTEDRDTHELRTDGEWLGSARLEVDGGSGHSRAANGWGMARVSKARGRRRIGTLTDCERMGNGSGQQGSRSTEDRHTHTLRTDGGWLGSARLEVDGGSAHSRAANGWGMAWVSKARSRRRIDTLTICEWMGNALGQQGAGYKVYGHTHALSTETNFIESAISSESKT